jgi:hypothetical protein
MLDEKCAEIVMPLKRQEQRADAVGLGLVHFGAGRQRHARGIGEPCRRENRGVKPPLNDWLSAYDFMLNTGDVR